MSAIDDVLGKYRDAFGVRDDRANELHKKACVELSALRTELESVCRVRDELSIELYEAKKFHPRAMKLIAKKKNFVVVADNEEYFIHVYATIRKHEKEKGTWTGYDEIGYAERYRKIMGEPTEEECRAEMSPFSEIGETAHPKAGEFCTCNKTDWVLDDGFTFYCHNCNKPPRKTKEGKA